MYISATLPKLEDFFDNLSGKLEYKTAVSIKNEEEILYLVEQDKLPRFPESNILENRKREVEKSVQLSLNWYHEDVKNADWIDNDNVRKFVNDTLPRPYDNLVTNKDGNNQLEFDSFTEDFDRKRVFKGSSDGGGLAKLYNNLQGAAQDRLKLNKIGRN